MLIDSDDAVMLVERLIVKVLESNVLIDHKYGTWTCCVVLQQPQDREKLVIHTGSDSGFTCDVIGS
jgi:hypothetical protein